MENLIRPELSTDWVAWYFIGLLAIFAWLRTREFGEFLSTSFGALFLFETPQKLQNKTLSSYEASFVLCLQQIHLSLILSATFNLTTTQFWICSAILVFFMGLRVISFHYLGLIFDQDYFKRFSLYYYLYFELTLFFIVLGTSLSIYILHLNQDYSLYLLIFIGILYLFTKFRIGFQIFVKLHISIFYIFLYFCALEFTPLLWGYYFLK